MHLNNISKHTSLTKTSILTYIHIACTIIIHIAECVVTAICIVYSNVQNTDGPLCERSQRHISDFHHHLQRSAADNRPLSLHLNSTSCSVNFPCEQRSCQSLCSSGQCKDQLYHERRQRSIQCHHHRRGGLIVWILTQWRRYYICW